jgi:hypothetical protein
MATRRLRIRRSAKVFFPARPVERLPRGRNLMNTLSRALEGVALVTILSTGASAESPSWPTPLAPQAESLTAPRTKLTSPLSAARLGQILAPIALYPDDLLSAILIAATYPLDVVEAARWLQDLRNAAVRGDQLFAALQQKPWDPSVKSLAPFPRILRMLDANLEWTERLGEAYLADPAAVMDAVQRLRRRAQLAGRLVTTPQENVRIEQQPTRIDITIEPETPEVVYVSICDPSFAYGPWPYPDYPPFFPLFAGATINGCGWISGPIVAPFWGLSILNFRTGHVEIDRKRLALFDRDREGDHDPLLGEEWRHDPGHRGNVPYRDAAVSAMFGSATPAASFNPGFRGRLTAPYRVKGPLTAQLPPKWQPPAPEGAQLPLRGGRAWPEGIRAPLERGQSSTARVQSRFGSVQPALDGVAPIVRPVVGIGSQPLGGRGPGAVGVRPISDPRFGTIQPALKGVDPDREPGEQFGQPLNRDAETRMLIERELMGWVPPTALPAPLGGLGASPSSGRAESTRLLGARQSFRPLVGIGAQSFRGGGPAAIGAQPFIGRGPQLPPGGPGAGGRAGN